VRERDLRAEARAEIPDLVRPLLELRVVGDAPLQRDRIEFGPAGGLARRARVAAFAVLHQFRRPLQRADLADAGHVAAVPLDAELEVLVRIEPGGVHTELRHQGASLGPAHRRSHAAIWPANCWILRITNSAGLRGAKPTRMLTMPRLMSFCVVVSLSHFTRYASRGVRP